MRRQSKADEASAARTRAVVEHAGAAVPAPVTPAADEQARPASPPVSPGEATRPTRSRLWDAVRRANLRELWPDRFEAVVLVLLVLAAAYQLFVEPIVGVADNRDFGRLIDPAGIDYRNVAAYRESVFKFVETKYVFTQPASHRYLTSQRPILGAARALNRLLSKDGGFDLRCHAFCNLALYAVAMFVFLRAFRHAGTARRWFVAGAVLLVGTDVRLISYFNSFYCESASLIFLFATVGCALLCVRSPREGAKAWLFWLGYLGSAFLFWMAKSQNVAFAPCLALGAWFFFPRASWRGYRYLRALGAAAIPVGIAWAFLAGAYGRSTPTNARVVVAEEILPHSPRPAEDRRELAADGQDPTLFGIGRFYLHHPVRWWHMCQRQAKEAFGYLSLGNFTLSSGMGVAQSQAFDLWSELKKNHYPRDLRLLVALLVIYSLLAAAKARWLDRDADARMTTWLGPVLALGCALEFVVTVTFEANGTAKHLFIFNVAVDICLLLAVLEVADAVRGWRRRSAEADG